MDNANIRPNRMYRILGRNISVLCGVCVCASAFGDEQKPRRASRSPLLASWYACVFILRVHAPPLAGALGERWARCADIYVRNIHIFPREDVIRSVRRDVIFTQSSFEQQTFLCLRGKKGAKQCVCGIRIRVFWEGGPRRRQGTRPAGIAAPARKNNGGKLQGTLSSTSGAITVTLGLYIFFTLSEHRPQGYGRFLIFPRSFSPSVHTHTRARAPMCKPSSGERGWYLWRKKRLRTNIIMSPTNSVRHNRRSTACVVVFLYSNNVHPSRNIF